MAEHPRRLVALKAALFASGKHQQVIAKRARVAPQKLSHALKGRRELDAGERQRLAKVLGIPEQELFGELNEAVAS